MNGARSILACKSLSLLAALSLTMTSISGQAAEDELLDPEVAFVVTAIAVDDQTLLADFQIAEGYYLYRHRFSFDTDSEAVVLGEPQIPQGEKKYDDFFGDVETYRHNVQITLPYRVSGESPGDITLKVGLQGCADLGVCYPPDVRTVSVGLPATGGTAGAPPTSGAFVSEQDQIANTLMQGVSLLTLLSFFGFGLLLAFTPCVFPMIPILSGIIVGQGKNLSTFKAFILSLVYVLAMAATYTVAGVLVGLSGENIQALFQNAWILGAFAAVFVLLSLSMFGFYELQMPASVQSRLTSISNSQHGGTLLGVAIMGFLSALIIGPCVTAPLIGALIYIAQTGDAMLGGLALFALSLGMGAPLILIGASAGKLLPKAGPWMDVIKSIFGILLLAVAVWLLERVLPGPVTMALWSALLIVSAIYMGALDSLHAAYNGWRKLWKGLGLIMLVYGILLLIGAASGNSNPFKPLQQLTSAESPVNTDAGTHEGLEFEAVKGFEGLQQALSEASINNQPLMLDFYADWCVSCKEMEAFTFTDPEVQTALARFKLIQADVTRNDTLDKTLLKKLGLFGPPAILFFTPGGEELRQFRVVGFVPAEEFNGHIQKFLEAIAL
ncbi:MAG TPA: protein-disulfide reductase DsbD [Gammaproteobacteria bacterium]|jgi:thiol:disulfide interchange protein DsbD